MADLRDFTGKNRKFTGTIGERISTGTTAERDTSFAGGTLRFNTTTNLMEYYDGTQWKAIDAPPTISNISPATFVSDGSTIHTITVSGGNFGAGLTAKFIGQDGTEYTPGTTTVVSLSSVTMTTLTSMTVANEPYDIKITNVSGLFATLENALDAGSSPAFTASAGSLGILGDGGRAATSLTSQTFGPATDADGQQINYTITSGSISPGLRLGTPNDGNNGKIVGTATAVGTNTTSSFTIQASDGVNTASRAYSITVNAPVIETFTATGPGTFSVPVGISTISILMVAGGGSGGQSLGSGGGGGGFLEGTLTVTPGSSIAYNVGAGGAQSTNSTYHTGFYGGNTTFGPIPGPGSTATAIGGGYGCGHAGGGGAGDGSNPLQNTSDINMGGTGGSGGGTGSSDGPATRDRGGYGNQAPSAGLTGYGNNGGRGGVSNDLGGHGGGGGGGAGGVGEDTNADGTGQSGDGGIGRVSTISGSPVYYAGGGGGAPYHGSAHPGLNGDGGLGGGSAGNGATNGTSTAGGTNTGGGSGAGGHPSGRSGAGGPGIIIVKY